MTLELVNMVFVMGLLLVVLIAFIREWAPPEIIALSGFCMLVLAGVLSVDQAFGVFSNSAPITIAAMFILSAALEKVGVIDWLGDRLNSLVGTHLWITLPVLMLMVAACSAFINNTPVVAVMLPVLLSICRKKHIAASKILIPLSYAAVLGGCCTLIGSSTNILVNGMSEKYGLPSMGMFEFAPLGLMLLAVGIVYVSIFGPAMLPERVGVTALLTPEERKRFLCHVLIKPGSPLIGRRLTETEFADPPQGFRIIEVRREGARVTRALDQIIIHPYDRVLLAVDSRLITEDDKGAKTLKPELIERFGIENLSTIKGLILEGVVAPHSHLIGQSLRSIRFRQTYGMLALAIHRKGHNLASNFQDVPLRFGDTVLMLGPVSTFDQMRDQGDFMLLEDRHTPRGSRKQGMIVMTALGAVVLAAALGWMPIVFTATLACVVLMWLNIIQPQDAYKSIDWSIIFMLYGMLAVGEAMESTGAAHWLAESVVASLAHFSIPEAWVPYLVLSLIYLTSNVLTELLSNNATAVIMAPIAINMALSLDVDVRPFIFAVAFSASAAFSSPIGYQTHMMVYGAGGYRFADFVKFGLPLNLIVWIVASIWIPLFWPLD